MSALMACSQDDKAILPQVDAAYFAARAYPVLLRDCAFAACHGTSDRMFQVYGPGRARLPDPPGSEDMPDLTDPATAHEIEVSMIRARSMLLHRGELVDAPLLRKPLQGGAHFGTDLWQRNVYRDNKQSGYVVLKSWAEGVTLNDAADGEDGGAQRRGGVR